MSARAPTASALPASGFAPRQEPPAGALARFVADMRMEALPQEVCAQGSRVAADLVAVIAAGLREPELQRLSAMSISGHSAGASAVIGRPQRVRADVAALLHGTAGTALELDEGNRFSRGHPGIHVLPAALAVAQEMHSSGARLLCALVAGYEVAARLGAASRIRPVMHPHGTWGTVGAAVAVCKLRGSNAQDIENSIAIASTLGLATSVNTMRVGATVRNAFAGIGGRMGILAVDLASAGFQGEPDGLASVYDGVVAEGFTWDKMLDGLGSRWEICRNYFKLHACCRFAHAGLDALAQCLQGMPQALAPEDVAAIEVHTYGLAARLDNAAPANPLAAKYSLPFALASAIVHRATGVAAFSPVAVANARVQALARKVRVQEDPEMTRQLPGLRQARVELRLRSGAQYAGFAHTNRGDAEDPLSNVELDGKFMQLAQGTWSASQARELLARLLSLQQQADVSALFDLD